MNIILSLKTGGLIHSTILTAPTQKHAAWQKKGSDSCAEVAQAGTISVYACRVMNQIATEASQKGMVMSVVVESPPSVQMGLSAT